MFGRRFGVVAPGPGRWRFTAVAGLRFLDAVKVPHEARLTILEREGKHDQVQAGIRELQRQALGRGPAIEAGLQASGAQTIPRGIAGLIHDYEQSDPQAEMMGMLRARLRLRRISEIPQLRRFLR